MNTETTTRAKKPIYQSASRNETYNTCTQLYAAKYIWKLPDPGNEGSGRGNVCHDTLELLLKPRHKRLFDAAIEAGTCTAVPALWKLICRYAEREKVADAENLETIDQFMMVALRNEFHGPNPIWLTDPEAAKDGKTHGAIEAFAERDFQLDVDLPDGRRYRIKGYIDKTFIVRDGEGLIAHIVDYKGSKSRFTGEKATFNAQKIIYELAARHLFPKITRRRFRFLFLKFPRQPWQEEESMTDEQLVGYEYLLTEMQRALESFTLANAGDNLAMFDEEKQWLCGKEGTKKDGSPAWICPARRPLDYFVLVDKDGEFVASGFTEEELAPKLAKTKGGRIEPRRYPGCVGFFNSDGRPRNFN